MARRTKKEAQATRNHILDTAEQLFERRGVSRTSLHEIAQAAGVTRGAIYWHFKDKADLFNAMLERATLPLENCELQGSEDASLALLRSSLLGVLHKLATDPQLQRVFAIATHKVEYVDEMNAVRERHLQRRAIWLESVEQMFRRGLQRGELAAGISARVAALGMHALVEGLIQGWMLEPSAFDLVRVGRSALDTYLAGLAARNVAAAALPRHRLTPAVQAAAISRART